MWAHWDLLPTLAELAGAKTPAGLDGMSMARALRGQPQPTHEFFYWEFHERGFQQAVRMGNWKALRLKPGAPLELYDLPDDPHEQQNVAAGNPTSSRRSRSISPARELNQRAGPSSDFAWQVVRLSGSAVVQWSVAEPRCFDSRLLLRVR